MKKLLLLSTFAFTILRNLGVGGLLILSTFSFAQQYDWVDLSTNIPGETQSLYDIHFISPDTGWISSLSSPNIYYTTNGGNSFVIQDNEYNTTIQALYMFDTDNGYAGGQSGIVYKTTNGGIDWDYHGTIGGPTITDITFPPNTTIASTGHGCGVNGKTFEITSSGVNEVFNNIASDLSSVSFSSAAEGWACGENVIRRYSNGTWNTLDQSYSSGSYTSIYFVPGTTQGWCIGDAGIIIHTTDGMDWQIQPNPDIAQNALYSVFFKDTLNGWAVGTGGIILHTSDGGANWVIQTSGTTNTLGRVFPIDNVVYVTGAETLLKYTEVSGIGDGLETMPFEIYPNPAKDKFTVQGLKIKVGYASFEIYDLNGRKLLERQIKSGSETFKVDVSSLKNGIYFCRLSSENKSATQKLIIQK